MTFLKFKIKPIGLIETPYIYDAPYQTVDEEGEFRLVLNPQYKDGLFKLEKFKYIYVIYYMQRVRKSPKMHVKPPWAEGYEVGLFASRSPNRINPIGISVCKVLKIEDNIIYISGIDAFSGTPLIDIKPYIKELDSKKDANYGWLEDLNSFEHLLLHIKGIPHDY